MYENIKLEGTSNFSLYSSDTMMMMMIMMINHFTK